MNLDSLNPEQRMAAQTIQGPVLILAGAGTGKTRVITTRIGYMVHRGVPPENILAVTFTNKAAREMQERVKPFLPKVKRHKSEGPAPRPTIATFHSLCVRILRQHIEKLGYKRNFVIFSESEQISAVKKVMSHLTAQGEKTEPRAVLSLISKFKNGGRQAMRAVEPGAMALMEIVLKRYESSLKACNAVDFDDLILLTLRLFNEHPDALEACRAKYRYVMVDEYQDTNGSQFELVHSLTKVHRNFCVVGDDDQSIYGWRGAEVANLLNLEKHFPEVKIVKLEQNYRSTNVILSAANAVIKNNAQRRGKKLWSDKGEGEKILLHSFDDDEEEARTIVDEIEFMRAGRRIPWGAQAILFRTNLQSRPIELALRKGKVRYHLIGGQSFFDRREIKDFLCYLRVFINPNDEISMLRIANIPTRGLSDVTMERLLAASQERQCSVYQAMKNPVVEMTFQARTRESMRAFTELIEREHGKLLRAEVPDLAVWADTLLTDIGYYAELKRAEKDPEVAENRVQNLRDLMKDLREAGGEDVEPLQRMETFLEEVTLDNERAEEKEAGDAVTLITMHSCKGLEFPHVYIVGLEEGLLPHARSKVEGTLDEERRLFYVAITRAMKTLTMSHCRTRKKYGERVPCHPSSFLKEVPVELTVSGNEKGKTPVATTEAKDIFAAMRASLGT